jgi:hypothetical protein
MVAEGAISASAREVSLRHERRSEQPAPRLPVARVQAPLQPVRLPLVPLRWWLSLLGNTNVVTHSSPERLRLDACLQLRRRCWFS